MRTRYFSFLSLALAAGFLVVASQAFALYDIANVALGVGIGLLVVALATAIAFRRHAPSLVCASLIALISAWLIVASQVFSLETVQTLTFADSLGILGVAIVGLTAHELTTERVVHSLAPEGERGAPVEGYRLREPAAR